MNKNFEQYIKRAKEVGMTSEEKERIFSNLKAAVLATPEGTPSFLQFRLSGFSFQFSRQAVSVFAVLAVIILTTGTSFAAGGALPGDILYPVKINLNEKVEGYVALSRGAKEDFEVKAALTRLQEAEQLESEGRLDIEAKEIIETNFQEHAANLTPDAEVSAKLVLTASSTDSSDSTQDRKGRAIARFHAALEDHRDALKRWSDVSKDSSKPNLYSLIQTVDYQLKMRANVTATSTNPTATSTNETSIKVWPEKITLDEKGTNNDEKISTTTEDVKDNSEKWRPKTEGSPPSSSNNNSNSQAHTDVHQNGGSVLPIFPSAPIHLP